MSITPPKNDKYYSNNMFAVAGVQARYDRISSVLLRHIGPGMVRGMKVIDLGCGLGGFGRKFLEMGADVVFIDGRADNIAELKADLPNAKAFVMDIERDPWPDGIEEADLLLCMGLIYHTADPKAVFEKTARISDNICVETNCLDHDGVALISFQESNEPRQFSLSGNACRPSPKWLENALKDKGFPLVKDISHKDANREPQPGLPGEVFDWEFQRTCGWRRNECSLRKMFIASKTGERGIFHF